MKARAVILTVAVCLAAVAVCRATDLSTGTWKLNEAKSHLGPGITKNSTVTYEPAGDSVRITLDGTDAAGNPTHIVWTGKFDSLLKWQVLESVQCIVVDKDADRTLRRQKVGQFVDDTR